MRVCCDDDDVHNICGVTKQNESEVDNDMLLVSEFDFTKIFESVDVKTRHLSQVHD